MLHPIKQLIESNKKEIVAMMQAKEMRTISFVSGLTSDDVWEMESEHWLDAINEDNNILVDNQLPTVLVEDHVTIKPKSCKVLAVHLCVGDIIGFYGYLEDEEEVEFFTDDDFSWETGWYLYEEMEKKIIS